MCAFTEGQRVKIAEGHPRWAFGTFSRLLADGKAEVHFKRAREPVVCQACGGIAHLSRNASTGEIVCMRTGCGEEHGFDVIVETLPIADISSAN